MPRSIDEQLEQDLPIGNQAMFLSLRDAGFSNAPRATNVRWVNFADDDTPIVNLWRDDIGPRRIHGRWVVTIRPGTWSARTASRRSKRDELVESLTANAGNFVRVVVLERNPRDAHKHAGTRFDCDFRWRVEKSGNRFQLHRALPGEAGDETPPKTPAEYGKLKPGRHVVVSRQIERSGRVKALTLARARHRCENPHCADYLHYESMDVHHVTSLGRRGADHLRNTVALCPACHTRVHRGRPKVRERLERAIKAVLQGRRKP
jgi:hypothetical protein